MLAFHLTLFGENECCVYIGMLQGQSVGLKSHEGSCIETEYIHITPSFLIIKSFLEIYLSLFLSVFI